MMVRRISPGSRGCRSAPGSWCSASSCYAYFLTDSVGLLSDALESTVNIVAAVVALVALKAAARPGDERHHFGLSKAEYFSALFEGLMILIAAGLIMFTAIPRFLDPQPLEDLGIGLFISGDRHGAELRRRHASSCAPGSSTARSCCRRTPSTS